MTRPRFISITHSPPITPGDTTCNVVIGQAEYWMENGTEILAWLDTNAPGARREGMVLTFPDEPARLAFMLAWG